MEKIKIGTRKEFYEIKDIRPISSVVMQIVFVDQVPPDWGKIKIYTEDGTEADTLTGYETVYRREGRTVCLSNDGSIDQKQEKPKEVLSI